MNLSDKKRFEILSTAVLAVLVIVVLMPIVLVFVSSITDEKALISSGYKFLPQKLSWASYYYMVQKGGTIFRAYGISILVTALGTAGGVLITAMIAYPMSRRDFRYRNILAFFVFFTMLFNGGVVASFIMWSRILGVRNTIWALVLPNYLVMGFNVFLVRNYYANSVPESLIEAAQLDGAKEMTIFRTIMLPLAIPTVATISLFSGLAYWNDWINGLYYITDPKMYNIQNLLIRIMNNIQFLKSSSNAALLGTRTVDLPGSSVRMALAVIGMLPVLVIYPFVQRHFIRGVIIGAVKG